MYDSNLYVVFSMFISERCKGFVYSQNKYKEVTENSPLFAVDCEMVCSKQFYHLFYTKPYGPGGYFCQYKMMKNEK